MFRGVEQRQHTVNAVGVEGNVIVVYQPFSREVQRSRGLSCFPASVILVLSPVEGDVILVFRGVDRQQHTGVFLGVEGDVILVFGGVDRQQRKGIALGVDPCFTWGANKMAILSLLVVPLLAQFPELARVVPPVGMPLLARLARLVPLSEPWY